MQIENIATPFGRRPAKLAHLQQHAARETIVGKVADKWRVFHAISVAMTPLKLSSTCIALLRALVSFYPEDELSHVTQLVVFPSNRQLSLRANGMAEATIRRNITILVETGLIIRRDSANGKRFARKGEHGQIASVFGFDLSPLLARAEEFELMAQRVEADRATLRHAKEDLTICRRDVRKLIDAAIEDNVQGDWLGLEQVYFALVARIPRKPSTLELVDILDEMTLLRQEVINRLNLHEISENDSGNAADSERHIQDSKPEHPFEFENSSEGMKKGTVVRGAETLKMFSLEMVLRMCPQISDYAPGGRISSWRDLLSTAVTVRSMLGVSPSAYQDACEVMGPENAATIMACILERAGHINSAGGYLRDLTARSRRGEFSLRPMLMALSRTAP